MSVDKMMLSECHVLSADVLDPRIREGDHERQSERHGKDDAIVHDPFSEHLSADRAEGCLLPSSW